ncbi:hypothetical protein H5U35_00450, partial [Candidatus Aerophobetes bacterium]|nr:hypothetical protein [Candidatus Aerophobetes bacterium]
MDKSKNFSEELAEKDQIVNKTSPTYDSLNLYFKCISSFPVLSKQEEKNLAK